MSDNGLRIMSEDVKGHDRPGLGGGWTAAYRFFIYQTTQYLPAFGHWQRVTSATRAPLWQQTKTATEEISIFFNRRYHL